MPKKLKISANPVNTAVPTKPDETAKWKQTAILFALTTLLLLLLQGWPIVALVNYQPIFRWQLNSILMSRFGKQSLEQIISQKLIDAEAKKLKIEVTQAEIEAKTQSIVASLGNNLKLEDLLQFQGLTQAEFTQQLETQLIINKILSSDVVIAPEEIKTYLEKNRSLLTATTEAELQKEAEDALIDQKISEKLQPWFLELKNKAKILRLL